MAKTITQLPDATTVGASDEIIVQQSGVTKRATVTELKAEVASLGANNITVSGANRSITNTGNFALSFGTNNTERVRVHANGDVSFNSTGASINTTVGGASWTSTGYHVLYSNATLAANGIIDYHSDWVATNRNVFRVQADGNALNFNNSYGALSDVSIKENIEDATPKLDALKQVRVVNFNRIGDPDNKQIGMVAQELEAIWPKLISEDQDGLKSIKYSVLVPILVKAVQELADKVEALEAA